MQKSLLSPIAAGPQSGPQAMFPFGTKRYGLDKVRLPDWCFERAFPHFDRLPGGSIILGPGGGAARVPMQASARGFHRNWSEFCVELIRSTADKYNDRTQDAGLPDRAVCADFLSPDFQLPSDVSAAVKAACGIMFHHQFEDEDSVRAARNVRRFLPKGGRYYFDVPNELSAFRRLLLGDNYVPGRRNDVRAVMGIKEEENPPILIRFHTHESAARISTEAGFVNVKTFPTQERMGWESCFDQPEDWIVVECENP